MKNFLFMVFLMFSVASFASVVQVEDKEDKIEVVKNYDIDVGVSIEVIEVDFNVNENRFLKLFQESDKVFSIEGKEFLNEIRSEIEQTERRTQKIILNLESVSRKVRKKDRFEAAKEKIPDRIQFSLLKSIKPNENKKKPLELI